jgi:hypothetical protein
MHGTLSFELSYRKAYHPTRKEDEMIVVIDPD